MAIIYLTRHTKYSNPNNIQPGRLPVELSEEGIKQANNLREFYRGKNVSRIYSSPILRCNQTAKIIADGKISIEFDVRLAETLSVAQGSVAAENWRKQLYSQVEELGGESEHDVQNRMADFWENAKFEDDKEYIVCSHGDPLLFLFQYLNGDEIYADLSVDEPEYYQLKGSVRVVEYRGKGDYEIVRYIENEEFVPSL